MVSYRSAAESECALYLVVVCAQFRFFAHTSLILTSPVPTTLITQTVRRAGLAMRRFAWLVVLLSPFPFLLLRMQHDSEGAFYGTLVVMCINIVCAGPIACLHPSV